MYSYDINDIMLSKYLVFVCLCVCCLYSLIILGGMDKCYWRGPWNKIIISFYTSLKALSKCLYYHANHIAKSYVIILLTLSLYMYRFLITSLYLYNFYQFYDKILNYWHYSIKHCQGIVCYMLNLLCASDAFERIWLRNLKI